jgi:hypothetical protein
MVGMSLADRIKGSSELFSKEIPNHFPSPSVWHPLGNTTGASDDGDDLGCRIVPLPVHQPVDKGSPNDDKSVLGLRLAENHGRRNALEEENLVSNLHRQWPAPKYTAGKRKKGVFRRLPPA